MKIVDVDVYTVDPSKFSTPNSVDVTPGWSRPVTVMSTDPFGIPACVICQVP